MNTTDQLAAFTAYLDAHPAPPRRPLTDAELAAEDYWAGIGEARRDEALMADGDDRWLQERADNYLEREWVG